MSIILLVCFVVVMLIWLLSMLPAAAPSVATYSPWLAWFACLCLGLAVFASGIFK